MSTSQLKSRIPGIIFPVLVLCACISFKRDALSDDGKGTQIAQSVYDRPDGKTLLSHTTMILQDGNGRTRERQFYSYRKDVDNGDVDFLMRFTIPADVEGTGLLTLSHPDGENDQWVYLPALENVRRIAGDRKGGRFVGSDLYYEDLQDRKVSQDTHTYIGQEEYNGAKCDVIESIPVTPDNSSYSKKVAWIHPQTMIPVRIDFYRDGRNTPMKRLEVKKIDQINGYWTVMETKITDLDENHITFMKNEAVTYDTDLPDELFSEAFLQNPEREKSYRAQ